MMRVASTTIRTVIHLSIFTSTNVHVSVIKKRSLYDFASMIACSHTGKAHWDPLNYVDYGCWCGSGSYDTNIAVDQIDQVHDLCYETLVRMKSCSRNLFKACAYLAGKTFEVYCKPYAYTCVDGKVPTCNHDKMNGDECAQRLCECDAAAAICFATHVNNYPYGKKPKCPVQHKKQPGSSMVAQKFISIVNALKQRVKMTFRF